MDAVCPGHADRQSRGLAPDRTVACAFARTDFHRTSIGIRKWETLRFEARRDDERNRSCNVVHAGTRPTRLFKFAAPRTKILPSRRMHPSREEMRSLTGVCDRKSQDFTVVESAPGADPARILLSFEAHADSQP